MFWSGLAVTGPAIAGMMQLTEARWSPSVRRVCALTTIGFLPVAVSCWSRALRRPRHALSAGCATPIPVKAAWLNTPFFWPRTLVLAAVLFRVVLRVRGGAAARSDPGRRTKRSGAAAIGWPPSCSCCGSSRSRCGASTWSCRSTRSGTAACFGGYFAVSTLYTALLPAVDPDRFARTPAASAPIPPAAVQDVAKLQFAMSIMWMYFFWSQYLVIWYGNVPVETRFFAQPVLHCSPG